jgi:hypothetical protein
VGSFLDRRLNIHPKLVKITLLRKNPLISKCPALVTLYSKVDKALIFRNCHELKFSRERVSIVDDPSPEDRAIRKTYDIVLRDAKDAGKHVKFVGCGSVLYIYGKLQRRIDKIDNQAASNGESNDNNEASNNSDEESSNDEEEGSNVQDEISYNKPFKTGITKGRNHSGKASV